jgi:RNA-directed DNA polymerase
MVLGPTHVYIREGLKKGVPLEVLRRIVSDSKEANIRGLPPVYSLKHLCHYTGVNYQYLRNIIRRKRVPYVAYRVKKRSGGFRFLQSPEEDLKFLQRWVAKEMLYKVDPHWRCFSFHRNASIKKCAAEHCQSRWLIKIDIEKFFDSISEVQVYKVFRVLGYKPLLAFELARLCTVCPRYVKGNSAIRWVMFKRSMDGLPYSKRSIKYIGYLPQGAPTSPQLSNLVFADLDAKLLKVAEENGMIYTRYADDICFSTIEKGFARVDAVRVVSTVNRLLSINGFNPQKKKLKIIPPGGKKIVLGLGVDSDSPKLTKAYLNRIAAHLRGVEIFGSVEHASHRKFSSVHSMLDHVRGLIAYTFSIESRIGERFSERFDRLLEAEGLEL